MARGKVQLKRIENPVHRQVTFCKRRAGLLKKAKELSVLCDAEIGVIIFSSHGKLYELATKGTMQGITERYMKSTGEVQPEPAIEAQPGLDAKEEINMLKQEIDILQKGLRYMFGGTGGGTMTLDELDVLEKHLEVWICNIRSTKMNIMFQEIQLLRNKEGMLKAANKYLQDKIEDHQNSSTAITDFAPINTTNFPYPLTILQNDQILKF
ncbi:agamous-like MADS-box protein AGL12 [Juglans microcarpa x Juglans regia]|uniref:agamous-like MADS-box protein AGL12 n=1 Tax=Juglans microcarpa x Juglans regia TaxID=2249226 RepID=UPI001B7F2EDD|nr:agamous-like MADS-box protein AGL12 [Juglans microcarpa x Juglans regia]